MKKPNVLLLEVQPRNPTTGARTTVRLAGGGADYPYRYGGQSWQAGLAQIPTIVSQLDYRPDDLAVGAVPQALTLEWRGSTDATLNALANMHWKGAPFTLYMGEENAAGTLPAVLITGTVLTHRVTQSALQIGMADPAADLQRPIIVDTFSGAGGIDGPAEWEGRRKRRVWGQAFNIEGEPIDPANNIHCFGDPSKPWQSFDAVRDMGAAAASLTTQAWAGSIAATFAALQAASAPTGGGVICPSLAMVKWWTRPAGILAADVHGEVGSGYVETAAGIAQAIVVARSGPAFLAGTVTAANAMRTRACGYVADDLTTSIAAALDWLLGGVSLFWVLEASTGQIRLGEYAFGASVASFRSDHVDRADSFPPLQARKIGYRQNHRVHTAGDIAGSVTYGDGTPLDDLQPAEAGADVTATAQVTCEMVTDRTVAADYTGAISAPALDGVLWSPVVVKGGTSVKLDNATTYALSNAYGVASGTGFVLDNTNGSSSKGNITIAAGTTLADTAGADLVITVAGVAQPKISLRLTKDKALPPGTTGGGGGTGKTVSWSSGEMVSINSTSYVALVTEVKTLTLASGESLYALADLALTVAGSTAGTRTETVVFQYSPVGAGSWSDFPGGATTSTTAASGYISGGSGEWVEPVPGYIYMSQTKSGLAAGDWDVRAVALLSATGRYVTPEGTLYCEAAP